MSPHIELRGWKLYRGTAAERGTFIALRRLKMRGYRAKRICTNANESPWHDGSVTFLHRKLQLTLLCPGASASVCVCVEGGRLIITNSAPQLSPQILPLSSPCLSQSQASDGQEGGDSRW